MVTHAMTFGMGQGWTDVLVLPLLGLHYCDKQFKLSKSPFSFDFGRFLR